MPFFRVPDLRLTVKLPLLIVATAVAVALAASLTASWTVYSASERLIKSHLSVIALSKRDQIEALMRAVRSDLQSIAGNPSVQRSLDGFGIGFKILTPDDRAGLVQRYADDAAPSAGALKGLSDFYGAAHQSMHPYFKAFAAEHGYDDVLFVDRDGNVAYSLARRADFTRNVAEASLADSVLGEVVRRAKVLAAGDTTVVDFRAYGPAGGPVSFAATPVYQRRGDKPDFCGVLILQVPGAAINRLMNKADGFSGRGEAVIVGRDGLLRSSSRFGGPWDILGTHLDDARLAQAENDDVVVYTNGYRGSMIAAAVPFQLGGIRWAIVAAENTADVFAPMRDTAFWIVAICLVVTVVLTIVAAFVSQGMARPIVELAERFDAALSNMPHGLCMIDGANRLILANTAYNRMYGLPASATQAGTPAETLVRRRLAAGSGPADIEDYAVRMAEVAAGRQEMQTKVLLEDGRTIHIACRPLPSGGYVAAHQDITDAIRAEDRIRHMAAHDALTGLPNRVRLRERMEEALLRTARGEKLAVLCLDLDHFKAVNDTLGHPVGDLLLQAVTERLQHCVRDADTVARLGGDEFVVLQTGVDGPEGAGGLARRIIAAVGEPYTLDGHQIIVGASVGIAFAPTDGRDADALLKNADMALYRAKADGRGTARFFETTMDARLQERRQLELDLRRALAKEEFELHFQPIVDTRTEAISGFEALVRWNHPQRGLVAPGEFVSLAEDIGLIVPMGEWILRAACREAAAWPSPLKIAVNLSPAQFKSVTLLYTVVSALGESGLSPRRLELEITESVLLADNAATLAMLHQLRALGIRIAMDDFGTGYSSLSYLRSFPFDKIKIDKSFVQDLADSADRTAIVKAVAGLGSALGMATTAEGVETAEQFRQVREQGCTEAQGYFFSRPVPAAQARALIEGETALDQARDGGREAVTARR